MTRPREAVLLAACRDLRRTVDAHAEREAPLLERIPEAARPSARNLLHYLALRSRELRPLQRALARIGLSSLGRSESHVRATLDAVIQTLERLEGREPADPGGIEFEDGEARLAANAEALLGPAPEGRGVRIMVTLPSAAATDPRWADDLIAAGMDLARINAAHDDVDAWDAMADHVRSAAERHGRPCRILFDLGGPKLRTGPAAPGPAVLRFKPRRDARGSAVAPARILVHAEASAPADTVGSDGALPVDEAIATGAAPGDELAIRDVRGRRRTLRVVERVTPDAVVAEAWQSGRVEGGTAIRWSRDDATIGTGNVGTLPPIDEPLVLRVGDRLWLHAEPIPARPPEIDDTGRVLRPAHLGSTLGTALASVREGEPVWFDDGSIGTRVVERDGDRLLLEVEQADPSGARLKADKGINLPDTDLELARLTDQDLEDLDFAVRRADLVGMSFVERPADVARLVDELQTRSAPQLGVVLKIETRRAFEALPRMLLTGLRSPPLGVMVARGDLAVEVGFARLAEVQEEILWLCEAAHVPVIWATQVLETLAKTGRPSRAEVSDAALGVRAECVMLNKGPHIATAVRFLDDVLSRMRGHVAKKSPLLRRLHVATTDDLLLHPPGTRIPRHADGASAPVAEDHLRL